MMSIIKIIGFHATAFRRCLSAPIRPARTFPAMMPWLRLDRIYVRGFRVEMAEVLKDGPWARLSDHAPIVTELQLA